MHVERLTDDGDELLWSVDGTLLATATSLLSFDVYYYTRDQLREMLPHLAAWCETGSLEVKDGTK